MLYLGLVQTFTLQSPVTQKMVFLVRVRYIIARYYVSSIQARYT